MSTAKTKQTLLEPQIILLQVEENALLELDDVLQMHKNNLKLSKGQRFSVLLDTRKSYFSTSAEALRKLSSKEFQEIRKATAIIVDSLAARLIGNFFKSLQSRRSPTRLFNTIEEALIWLRKF
jgi:hypothetical protein